MTREEHAADLIKEVYEHIRDGKVSGLSVTHGENGSVSELLVTDDDFRARVVVGRDEMTNWR